MASPLSNPNSQGARSERDYLDLSPVSFANTAGV